MHLECYKASKCVKGTQWQSRGVSRVFLGWFKAVSKESILAANTPIINFQDFLAAMSSVCSFVCVFVCPFFFFSVLGVCSAKEISRLFERSVKGV